MDWVESKGVDFPRETLRDEMIDLMIRVINSEPTQAERNGMDVFTFTFIPSIRRSDRPGKAPDRQHGAG